MKIELKRSGQKATALTPDVNKMKFFNNERRMFYRTHSSVQEAEYCFGMENIMSKQQFKSPAMESNTIDTLSARLLKTTADLMQANQQLEQIQRERSEMLSNISHDLRAPVTAIRSAVDLLNSGHALTAEETQHAIHLIDRRTAALENLIQDMYLLFSIENPSVKLKFEDVPAGLFLEEYFYDTCLNSLYENKNMQLDLPENLAGTLHIDIQNMIRVLDNLFTNAAKYSLPGASITMRARILQESSQLKLEIIDTGIGIPADSLTHIFERTYTVSRARTPEGTAGSGLGLCIVRTILDRFDASISCSSIEGEGSTFTILLPVK